MEGGQARHSPILVAVPSRLLPGFLDGVRAVSPRIETVLISNDDPLPSEIDGVPIFYRSYALRRRVVDQVIARARGLRWMHVPAAGVDIVWIPSVLKGSFTITHMGETYDVPVAEFTLAQILAAAKCLPRYLQAQRAGVWHRAASWDEVQQEGTLPQLLRGKTIGMVGFGGIGTTLAEMVQPLGMRVLAVRRGAEPDPRAAQVYGPDAVLDMLPQCDYVVLAMPLTPLTERSFGAREVGAMKSTAWLINIARGKLVDDEALVTALESGRIAGACLDVFSHEPLPAESPYYRLPNVVLTPHVAGVFPDLNTVDRDVFVSQLQRYVAGEPLRFVVDRARGY